MDPNSFPTKGNLMLAKNSLKLAKQGYELMDKKRNILIRELMDLIDKADEIQKKIMVTYVEAYNYLQEANIDMGISHVMQIADTIPLEENVEIKTRSIMGVEIPLIRLIENEIKPSYSFSGSTDSLDKARIAFEKVKNLTVQLSGIENAAYRLAYNVKKTQKRANALENITIPYYNELCISIGNALEEKEREEFTRLKVVKRQMASRK